MTTRLLSLAAASVAIAAVAQAQQHHAHPPAEVLGTAHFQTSCAPAVTSQFDRAVTLLHSFEFGASIRGFREVLASDSTCAMAHWGIALSRWGNPMAAGLRSPTLLKEGLAAAQTGARLAANATERERMYLASVLKLYENHETVDQRSRILAYVNAMSDLAARQPADTEATIFYALALSASALPTDKTYANQLKAGSILEPLWEKQPQHPGLAHYIIHTYDAPPLAARAAAAAQRYAAIAPSAAHALHMPSHTFTRVGQWNESITTNFRSLDVARTSASVAEMLHATDYAVYAYLQLGQDSAARVLLDSLPAFQARFDPNAITGAAPPSAGFFALAAIPSRYALERRDWRAAAALQPVATAYPWTEAITYFTRSLGASRLGDTATARASIDSLAVIHQRLVAKGERDWSEQVAIQRLGAQAWLDFAQRRTDSALVNMREAARREDLTEKNAVTPGPLAPARELLGDMLLELKRPREALAEYQATLVKEPNRFRSLYGAMRAATLAGEKQVAQKHRVALRKLVAKADRKGRPELKQI